MAKTKKRTPAQRSTKIHDFKTEDDVKIKFLVPYLRSLGYPGDCLDFNKAIVVQEGRKQKTIFADVVVYASAQKKAPIIVCETKAPDEVLTRFVREQAISYARLLPRIAPITLITNGAQTQVFQTLNKNRIADVPTRESLQEDLVNFIVSSDVQEAIRAEAKHGLFIIDDVQTFKNVLKSCHNEIRNNEGADPTVAFDEMSKVLFCKLYEEKEHPSNNRFRLSVFDDSLKRLSVNVVQKIFEETKVDARYAGLFNPGDKINLQDRTIRRIVGLFENYDLSLTAFDVKGEAFEYFLSDTFTGGLGEYFTPRNIVEFMVELIDPKIGDRIIDPFCGTGGFLIYSFDVVSEKIRMQEFSQDEKAHWRLQLSDRSLFGTDWKERTSQACKMNMMVHGDGSAGIFKHHGLVDVPDVIDEARFNICLTNPPFGATENDPAILAKYDLGSGRKAQDREALAIERSLDLVKPGGWVGIVVPDGLLNNQSKRYVREYIKQNAWVKAVVSLAEETFEGYGSGAKTSILFLQRKGVYDDRQEPVFMAVASNTGYAPNGGPVPGNELPDILLDYTSFIKGSRTFRRGQDTWVVDVLGDRLDAEFYWKPKGKKEYRPLAAVQQDVTLLLREINAEYAAIEEAIAKVLRDQDFQRRPLHELLEQVEVPVKVLPDESYKMLGVRWWGEGAFVRGSFTGAAIKAARLYQVSPGWVVYNRLFAKRGSFAVLTDAHAGCYVSGEFPTFKVRSDVEHPARVSQYIVHCLNSPQAVEEIEALSTGSTKRSRGRLTETPFLNMEIQVPRSPEGLEMLVTLLNRATALRPKGQAFLDRAKELAESASRMLPRPYIAERGGGAD